MQRWRDEVHDVRVLCWCGVTWLGWQSDLAEAGYPYFRWNTIVNNHHCTSVNTMTRLQPDGVDLISVQNPQGCSSVVGPPEEFAKFSLVFIIDKKDDKVRDVHRRDLER